jgi:hypothetical protein
VTASPREPGGALAALDRDRLGDLRPHLFRTRDFGHTWATVSADLPQTTFSRVAREDPARPELLYAGTEQGVFVTFNGGITWRPLGAGLPTTPVTGIAITGDDLVISTEGSGFWDLSGLGTLRQSAGDSAKSAGTQLFTPPAAYTVNGKVSGDDDEDAPQKSRGTGVNVDALIDARDLAAHPDVRLEIYGTDGHLVRTLVPQQKGTPGDAPRLSSGFVRVPWDLRQDAVGVQIEGALDGTLPGTRVLPGQYRVRLSTASVDLQAPMEIRLIPSLPQPTPGELAEKQHLLARIAALFSDVATTVNAAAERRIKLASRGKHRDAERLAAWELQIFDRRLTDSQARVNYGGGLLFDLKALSGYVDAAGAPVPPAMSTMCDRLERRWQTLRAALP